MISPTSNSSEAVKCISDGVAAENVESVKSSINKLAHCTKMLVDAFHR